jgi:hypothetical protein
MAMTLFFCLALAALLYLAVPLFWEPYWPWISKSPLEEVRKEKTMGIWAIADVDGEYEMEKLTEHDYSALRSHLKTELLEVMERERGLKKYAGSVLAHDIRPGLKRNLLYEVTRICGLKRV